MPGARPRSGVHMNCQSYKVDLLDNDSPLSRCASRAEHEANAHLAARISTIRVLISIGKPASVALAFVIIKSTDPSDIVLSAVQEVSERARASPCSPVLRGDFVKLRW